MLDKHYLFSKSKSFNSLLAKFTLIALDLSVYENERGTLSNLQKKLPSIDLR